MLVLSRRLNESITVDGPCTITVRSINTKRVSVAIEADRDVRIMRTELLPPEESGDAKAA